MKLPVLTKEVPKEMQAVHPPQHHNPHAAINYAAAAKEEVHEVATSPRSVALLGKKTGVEAWDKVLERLPSEAAHHKPEEVPKPIVLTKEVPQKQEVHLPQHHDPHALNLAHAAREEVHEAATSPRAIALRGKSGVEAWDRVLERLPSEAAHHKPEESPKPIVLTKEVPQEQEVHLPQHHDPHAPIKYAQEAREEVHKAATSPRTVSLTGRKSGVEAWDHVLESLPSLAKHEPPHVDVVREPVRPALHPPQHHDPRAPVKYAQAARDEVHEAATSPRSIALRGKSGVEAWDKVNESLPSQAEGHAKHDMEHMLAGFSSKEL